MLIVEDGTGLIDANAYISLADAAAYFGPRGNTKWFGGNPTTAQGTATFVNNPVDTNKVTVGRVTYTFKATLTTPAVANEVLIGSTLTESRNNLITAIAARTTESEVYGKGTKPNPDGIASAVSTDQLLITAKAYGNPGNDVVTSSDSVNITWATATLTGGTQTIDEAVQEAAIVNATTYVDTRWAGNLRGAPLNVDQALAFPRVGICNSCSRGQSMPPGLLTATAEYALRALDGPLAPDLVSDPSGFAITRRRQKLGPIERDLEFNTGSQAGVLPEPWKTYPVPDSMMSCMLLRVPGASQSRVIRS